MTTRQSTERVEQLMAEMDATGRDIERRGKVAAQHLRNAAKQASANRRQDACACARARLSGQPVGGDGGGGEQGRANEVGAGAPAPWNGSDVSRPMATTLCAKPRRRPAHDRFGGARGTPYAVTDEIDQAVVELLGARGTATRVQLLDIRHRLHEAHYRASEIAGGGPLPLARELMSALCRSGTPHGPACKGGPGRAGPRARSAMRRAARSRRQSAPEPLAQQRGCRSTFGR